MASEKIYLNSFPLIFKEWHSEKNQGLMPEQVTHSSSRKIWWRCCNGHEWQNSPNARITRGGITQCPYCAGKKLSDDRSLESVCPEISSEWNYDRNTGLKPSEVFVSSNKKVWWVCEKGHEWEAKVCNRSKENGTGCPFCAGNRISSLNDLFVNFPDLVKQWDADKNGKLLPNQFSKGSNKKVGWKCEFGHRWVAQINTRTKGIGCPKCKPKTSVPELRIFTEFCAIFENVATRNKSLGVEVDVFLSDHSVAIEYDGSYWHKDKFRGDMAKNERLSEMGINIIRIREKPLKKLSDLDIICDKKNFGKEEIDNLLRKIVTVVDGKDRISVERYLNDDKFWNSALFNEYMQFLPRPHPRDSLLEHYPALAAEWDYEKNRPLKPEYFVPGSEKRAHWICEKGHQWDAIISSRSRGHGCPICAGQKASKTHNLGNANPTLAEQWNAHRNGSSKPEQFLPGSNKKVWWMCKEGHEWQATINSRNSGIGCPYCSNKKVSSTNNLAATFPEIAKEWHHRKNYNLKPEEILLGSDKKYWWICSKGHEWEARV